MLTLCANADLRGERDRERDGEGVGERGRESRCSSEEDGGPKQDPRGRRPRQSAESRVADGVASRSFLGELGANRAKRTQARLLLGQAPPVRLAEKETRLRRRRVRLGSLHSGPETLILRV